MNRRQILLSNFISLSSVQVIQQLLPLITVPYLVRVLGPDKFGLIAFAQAFVQYFVLFTDYGFNLSATKEISIKRDNKEMVSEVFSSVLTIKIVFMILSFLVFCAFIFSIAKFRAESVVYLLTFGIVLGNVIFPVWLFQGLERMRDMAILNIIAKAIFTVSIFLFIKSRSDYQYVPLINSFGFIVSGMLSLWIIFSKFGVRLKVPTTRMIQHELQEGWHVFLSTIAISLYTISNVFILGLFTNDAIVGYFSAGEKIVKAVLALITPLSQTIYPHISRLVSESKEAALAFIRKILRIVAASTFVLSCGLFIFSAQISNIILGSQFAESIAVIRILSCLPFIIGLSNIFGIQTMLNFGLTKIFARILMTASLVNILMALILVGPLHHVGISISIVITEMFVTLSMFFSLQHSGIRLLDRGIDFKVMQ